MKPLVSVLIPSYQVEEYISRCLDSVLAQTYDSLEICIADDGSTDGTLDVVNTYVCGHSVPIKVEALPHKGVSYARQRLVEMSRGEHLFFLDSDDYIDPRTIEVLMEIAAAHNADVVQCAMEHTERSCSPPIDCGSPSPHIYKSRVQGMTAYLSASTPMRCMLAAKLYRRKMLLGIQFPIGKIHEDEATIHKILDRAQVTACTALPLYHYFSNPGSITKRRFSYKRYDALDVFRGKVEYCWQAGYYSFAKLWSLYYCVTCVKLYQATLEGFGPDDPHLPWLKERFHAAAEYYISTGLADGGFTSALRRQAKDLSVWSMPKFFDTAATFFWISETSGEVRRLLSQWPQIPHKEDELMKKLTIIIPVYNNPRELRMTIGSVLGSDFPLEDIEIIVADDGSSVDMKAVADEYTGRVDIRHFWQEDKGFRPGQARNMGIRAAKGEVCVFLDCGVIVTRGCLSEHWRLYQQNGPKAVTIGYIYGNDLTSDLQEMRDIIDNNTPDEAADIMNERGMLDGRERDYAIGSELYRWQAPWIVLWSLHFSVPTEFMRENNVWFDDFFCTWGCEDNDFGIQLSQHGAKYVLGRDARAIHYPAEKRSYDRLHTEPDFRAGWMKNREYLKEKWSGNEVVQLWINEGGRAVKALPLLPEEEA